MKDKKSIVLLVIASIILIISIIFALVSYNINKLDSKNSENEERVIEESKTKDLDATYTDFLTYDKDGNKVKLSDYKDSAVLVLFWSEENEDSVEMLNRINNEYEKYKNKIKFLAINVGEETVSEDLSNIVVPLYFDKNKEVYNQYKITEIPAMLYISSENKVFNSKTGLTTVDALEANLDILSENF